MRALLLRDHPRPVWHAVPSPPDIIRLVTKVARQIRPARMDRGSVMGGGVGGMPGGMAAMMEALAKLTYVCDSRSISNVAFVTVGVFCNVHGPLVFHF